MYITRECFYIYSRYETSCFLEKKCFQLATLGTLVCRVVVGLSGFRFFPKSISYTDLYDVFGGADSEWDKKISISKTFWWHNLFEIFENTCVVKKSKFENHIVSGSILRKMMRGFQIWPQNSNRITFPPPLLAKKTLNLGIF